MGSIVTVLTPAESHDLTTLARVKRELGNIDTKAHDKTLRDWIAEASEDVAGRCNRVFGKETVSEKFEYSGGSVLRLDRYPTLASGLTVTEVGTELVDADWELDAAPGWLYRMSDASRRCWPCGTITVQYTGGYELLGDLPRVLEQATILLVKARWHAWDRDPMERSVSTEGIDNVTYHPSREIDEAVDRLIARHRRIAV